MSVKLTPEPKQAHPDTGSYLAMAFGLPLVLGSFILGMFSSEGWRLALLLFVLPTVVLLMHLLMKARKKAVQARLDRENEGNEKRISHIAQIKKTYDVELFSSSGSKVKTLPAVQSVLVIFNGHDEPFDGRLSVGDGNASLRIRKDNDLVPAEQISAELSAGHQPA